MTIHLPTLIAKFTRIEAVLAGLDKTLRGFGERRRARNQRSMNG